jgi:hypothetical protein
MQSKLLVGSYGKDCNKFTEDMSWLCCASIQQWKYWTGKGYEEARYTTREENSTTCIDGPMTRGGSEQIFKKHGQRKKK